MRGIILSNGSAERMGGEEKEFFKVVYKGVRIPLVQRTVLMFIERGIEGRDIYVLSGKPVMRLLTLSDNINVVDPGSPEFMLVDWKKAMDYWGEECVITFGDVLWSERAMDTMFEQDRYRRIGSKRKHGGEGFGWKAFGTDKEFVLPHCDFAIDYIRKNGPRPGDGGWQMYRHMIGIHPEQNLFEDEIFCDIDRGGEDYTMDFDYPRDYDHYRAKIEPAILAEGKIEIL